jgi:hypothetical protein
LFTVPEGIIHFKAAGSLRPRHLISRYEGIRMPHCVDTAQK